MNFSEALAAIKKLDNGTELASAIEGEVEGLKTKNYEIIGEKRNASSKAQSLETAVLAIAKTLGITGDLDSVLSEVEGKVSSVSNDLKTSQTKVSELETRATTAEGKLTTMERQTTLTKAAAKAGAVPEVLERLLGDKVGELTIADDGVKIGDKPLKEYVEADAALKPFLPALFPAASGSTPPPAGKLPSGSPRGGNSSEERASRSYVNSTYGKTADRLLGKDN